MDEQIFRWNHFYSWRLDRRTWNNIAKPFFKSENIFRRHDPKEVIAHELGHVWDINSGNSYGVDGGGTATALTEYLGIKGGIGGICQFCNYAKDSWLRPQIPAGSEFIYNDEYGSRGINDYLAESFAWSVYGGGKNLPLNPVVGAWINSAISVQTSLVLP